MEGSHQVVRGDLAEQPRHLLVSLGVEQWLDLLHEFNHELLLRFEFFSINSAVSKSLVERCF